MADPNTRQGKRTPVTLKIKFKSETLEQFIERYAVDVSQGGIFIRTKEPLAVGTQMKFEFQLRDASPLIAGEGTVVWTRENDPSRPAIAPGMGVRFDRLADGSQAVLERILAEKAKQAPGRNAPETTKPPLFTDTPTRVAPAPVQEALGVTTRRPRTDSEQTPLPPPRPFHSDADDFDEKAFEEATKVRSLEELAAQTAGLAGMIPPSEDPAHDDAPTNTAIAKAPADELAARRTNGRAESTIAEPPAPADGAADSAASAASAAAAASAAIERESAPGLPEPPTRSKTPTAKPEDKPADKAADKPVEEARNKLGVEKAKAPTRTAVEAAPRADSQLPTAPKKSSAASIIILLLVLLAAGGAAVWFFVLREKAIEQVATDDGLGSAGSAVAGDPAGSGGAIGSAGSDTAMQDGSDATGSAGSAGSAAVVETPATPIVDTVIAASIPKGATVEVLGTDQKGAAPFTAKLEQDKAYKARVTAPGFMVTEIALKGGEKASAKLIAKPRIINVTTDPPGADIYVDGVNTQKITPSEVELTKAQAGKSRVRISLRRPGYRPVDQVVNASSFKEGDARMTLSITTKLAQAQRPTNNGSTGDGSTGTDDDSSAGGHGSGSATGASGTGTSGTGTSGTGTSGTGTSGTGTSGTGTSGTGTSGTGTGTSGSGTSGTGTGSAKATTPAGGTGSATKPSAGTGTTTNGTATPSASAGEPEPTWK